MIQFNLLPDVKIKLIKAKRMNRLVIGISLLSVAVCVLIMGIMFSLTAAQKQHLKDLNADIKQYTDELNGKDDLTKILTIQNQLGTLPDLYAGRPAVSRLAGYLDQTTPANVVGLTSVSVNFSESTAEISGTSDTLEALNRYVDTLKFTKYYVDTGEEDQQDAQTNAFDNVVLASFSKSAEKVTFTVELAFDPVIFDESQEVRLMIPNTITTRSQTSAPSVLFNGTNTEKQ